MARDELRAMRRGWFKSYEHKDNVKLFNSYVKQAYPQDKAESNTRLSLAEMNAKFTNLLKGK